MQELLHRWSDGYGASLTFTYVPGLADADPFAFVTFEDDNRADVVADAQDLRGIAAAALAMAEALEAEGATNA